MDHFGTRLKEIITERGDSQDAPSLVESARDRALARDLGLVQPDPSGDPNHFHPHKWVEQTVWDTRKRARNKGLEYSLSAGWILRRLERIDYCCEVSGIPFSCGRPRDSHKRPWMPSLDRIDCSKGYTPDNVRIVCVAVNTLLQDWGDTVFHAIIEAATKK